jgi:hypothetical protein
MDQATRRRIQARAAWVPPRERTTRCVEMGNGFVTLQWNTSSAVPRADPESQVPP